MIREHLKTLVEAALCGGGFARIARTRRRGATLILAYHNIVPDGEPVAGDASLHLPQSVFARQLDALMRTHQIVPLRDVLLEVTGSVRESVQTGRPRAVLTFDDATQGALTAGVAELSRRQLPATVFVAPGFVGGQSFWWDAVSGLDEGLRRHCLIELQGRDAAIRQWASGHGVSLREVPAHQTCGTEDQLHDAVAQGIELGCHTWDHPNLAALSAPELEVELVRPLAWLRERFASALPVIAYPYGLSTPAVAAAARGAGYEAALRVDGGWLTGDREVDPFFIPRQNVPAGLSDRGFKLLSSGVRLHR
jgi:peptidoglycan/xylan/chitin deacetylase (PgdA/CDA1 family)